MYAEMCNGPIGDGGPKSAKIEGDVGLHARIAGGTGQIAADRAFHTPHIHVAERDLAGSRAVIRVLADGRDVNAVD